MMMRVMKKNSKVCRDSFCCLACFFLCLPVPSLYSQTRTAFGVYPVVSQYPSTGYEWLEIFLQEALSKQLLLSEKVAVRPAKTMRWWKQNQWNQTQFPNQKQIRHAHLDHLIILQFQKVLDFIHIQGSILSKETIDEENRLRFEGSFEWKESSGELIHQITDLMVTTYPLLRKDSVAMDYSWDATEELYTWKAQLPNYSTQSYLQHKGELESIISDHAEIRTLARFELASWIFLHATSSAVPNYTLLGESKTILEELLLSDPNHDEYRSLLALIYYLQEERSLAKAEVVIANARNPQNGIAWVIYGMSVGRVPEEGKALIRKGLAYYPFLEPNSLFEPLAPEKRMIPILQTIIPIPAKQSLYEEWMSKGQISFEQRDWQSALRYFQQALQEEPKNISPQLWVIQTFIAQGKEQEALPILTQLEKEYPDHEKVALYYGMIAERKKDWVVAEEMYRKSLALKSDQEDALLRLSVILLKTKRYEEAESFLSSLVRRYPNHAKGWTHLGSLHWRKQQWSQAKFAWENAIRLEPTNEKLKTYFTKLESKLQKKRDEKD